MRREFGSGGSVVRKSPVSSQYCTPGVKIDERRCNNQPCRRGGYGTGQFELLKSKLSARLLTTYRLFCILLESFRDVRVRYFALVFSLDVKN